jgi:RHS repeat-associated protein
MGIKGEWKFVQPQIGGVNKYQFNGIELNDDFGLNWNMAEYRSYDASIGRWNGVDPLAEKYYSMSPYNGMGNNPIMNTDPKGDSIINFYQSYQQYASLKKDLKSNIANAKTSQERKAARKELKNSQDKIRGYKNYKTTESLIQEFKAANEDEYNKLNNLSFNGESIDIVIDLNSATFGDKGEDGHTILDYDPESIDQVESYKTGEKYARPNALLDNKISITLFQQGLNLETLANEFGDAIFGVEQPATVYTEKAKKVPYKIERAARFSFDYEDAIINKTTVPKSENYKRY